MELIFCYVAPVITALILVLFYKHKVAKWEIFALVAISTILVLLAKFIAIHSLVTDTIYYGGSVTEVRYYEDWNEYIHRTCTRCSGSGKSRSCTTYNCSYVKYHPEYWEVISDVETFQVTQQRYNEVLKRLNTPTIFKDMERNYHTDDGDMYYAKWDGKDNTLEPVVIEDTYENKPKASVGLFNFQKVDTADYKKYKPFDYPEIYNTFHQDGILGYSDENAERRLQILNSRLGKHSIDVKIFILIFTNTTIDAGYIQERYWEGSNKNEFVICIGIDNDYKITWTYDFSWTEVKETIVDTRDFIDKQKNQKLNLDTLVTFMNNEMKTKWKERDFKDFDYINIEPTTNQLIWIILLTIIFDVGFGIWIVNNDIED